MYKRMNGMHASSIQWHSSYILHLQVDPEKYRNMFHGFRVTAAEEGIRGFVRGWAPTFIGYSMQGLCKFGLYEVFKNVYSDMAGQVRLAHTNCDYNYMPIITGKSLHVPHQSVPSCISQCRVLC